MALKISTREVDGVAVVELEGRIVLGEESNSLRETVKGLLGAGQKKVVLNMDRVTYIDSAGLGALVAAHHSARTQGASLKLSNLGRDFKRFCRSPSCSPFLRCTTRRRRQFTASARKFPGCGDGAGGTTPSRCPRELEAKSLVAPGC